MKNKLFTGFCLAAIITGCISPSAAQNLNYGRRVKQDSSSAVKQIFRSAVADETAEEILKKHVAALGGSSAFAQIKTIETQSEMVLLGKITNLTNIQDVAGNRSVQRQESNGNVTETGFDGARAWQKSPFMRGFLDASSPQAKSFLEGGINLSGASLYNYENKKRIFTRLADERIGDANYLVVKSEKADEPLTKYYFDPATYLLKQSVTGNSITQTTVYGDYRPVEGVMVAFSTSIVNPQISIERKIKKISFNQPIDASVFVFEDAGSESPKAAIAPQPPSTNVAADEISEDLRLKTFESVWKTVDDTFFDRTFNGVDWQAMHAKYLPLAKSAAKKDEFYQILNRMLQELHLSHFKVLAPDKIVTLNSSQTQATTGTTGMTFKWIENELLVSNVKKDSAAARAGIRPGFIVKNIDGKTPSAVYAEYLQENVNFRLREELARVRSANAVLAGKAETIIKLEFLDEKNKSMSAELKRESQTQAGKLDFESKKMAGNVGYIRFNTFFGELLPKVEAALGEFKETKALIIDVRGNPGGAGDLGSSVAGMLNEQSGSLGNLQFRYEKQPFAYQGAGSKAYQGKIIILTDEGSGSTSEIFAGGLQANNRAVVIGSPSAGAVLASLMKLLPTSAALQHVVSGYYLPNGTSLEGRGVIPDVAVKPTRADIIAGRDPVIEKALAFAGKKK